MHIVIVVGSGTMFVLLGFLGKEPRSRFGKLKFLRQNEVFCLVWFDQQSSCSSSRF